MIQVAARSHIIVAYRGRMPILRVYVPSRMYLHVYLLVPGGEEERPRNLNNAIIIIFICFYLIVVSLFVTFCDIHCNSLAEFCLFYHLPLQNTIPRAHFASPVYAAYSYCRDYFVFSNPRYSRRTLRNLLNRNLCEL